MNPDESILKWWPVMLTGIGLVSWAVRTEMLAKRNTDALEEFQQSQEDKLTFYSTTADLSEVRGQVLVCISQLNDLKPTLQRLENKIDAILISRGRNDRRDENPQ